MTLLTISTFQSFPHKSHLPLWTGNGQWSFWMHNLVNPRSEHWLLVRSPGRASIPGGGSEWGGSEWEPPRIFSCGLDLSQLSVYRHEPASVWNLFPHPKNDNGLKKIALVKQKSLLNASKLYIIFMPGLNRNVQL